MFFQRRFTITRKKTLTPDRYRVILCFGLIENSPACSASCFLSSVDRAFASEAKGRRFDPRREQQSKHPLIATYSAGVLLCLIYQSLSDIAATKGCSTPHTHEDYVTQQIETNTPNNAVQSWDCAALFGVPKEFKADAISGNIIKYSRKTLDKRKREVYNKYITYKLLFWLNRCVGRSNCHCALHVMWLHMRNECWCYVQSADQL